MLKFNTSTTYYTLNQVSGLSTKYLCLPANWVTSGNPVTPQNSRRYKTKLHGFSPQANYADQATAAFQRS
jgi:hypothetical protein